jgi:ParB family chromosome partitioning protein
MIKIGNTESIIRMIPIEKIRVINPRFRNKHKFDQIVANISNLGLKRPITVNVSRNREGEEQYELVCGQGRLEAYIALGQKNIPAVVINVSREEGYLMSLVENLARRQYASIELVREIGKLKERGYRSSEIAHKIDMKPEYVRGILRLLARGEERLIYAVEKGYIPISLAVEISAARDEDAQRALLNAYESKKLKGRELIKVRRLIEQRGTLGKSLRGGGPRARIKNKNMTANTLVKTYRQEVERQTMLVKKAKLCEVRLVFIISALRSLFDDENFVNLVRAEEIDSMPKYIAEQIKEKDRKIQHDRTGETGVQHPGYSACNR